MSTTRPPAFDDQFTTPSEASRRGAHRARPKPAAAGLPVIAGIAVVLLVVGGVYAVLGTNPEQPAGGSGAVAAAPTSTSSLPANASTTAPGADPSESTTPSDPATTGSAGGDGSARPDHDISLVVLNSLSVPGLAKKVQADIEPDGWKVKRTDNSRQQGLATTKIYYGSSATKPTASALHKDLGYGILVLDESVAKDGLVVVLGQDAA